MSLNLNAAEILALSKILTKKVVDEARAAIDEEGEIFDLDFTVNITGILEVEEMQRDVSQINKLQPWQLLKHAMNKMNEATLNKFIKEAIDAGDFNDKLYVGDKDFKARTAKAWKAMAASTIQDRNGKITANGLELKKV